MRSNKWVWLAAGMVLGGVLTELAQLPGGTATAQDAKLPFANSVDQRHQNIEELRKLNALMQKQIDLLSSGRVRVIVVDEKGEGAKR